MMGSEPTAVLWRAFSSERLPSSTRHALSYPDIRGIPLVIVSPILAVTLRYALIPVVFTVVGAAAGAYWPAIARIRSHVLHLAAGVVFSVVAVELLPEIQRRALVWDVILGFAAGVAAMLLADKLLDRMRGEHDGDDHASC